MGIDYHKDTNITIFLAKILRNAQIKINLHIVAK